MTMLKEFIDFVAMMDDQVNDLLKDAVTGLWEDVQAYFKN